MTDPQGLSARIDRMEEKIDKLVDAVTELVRVEATLINMDRRLNAHSTEIKSQDGRIDVLEQKAPLWDLMVKVGGVAGLVTLTTLIGGLLALVIA